MRVQPLRFHFEALDPIAFPPGKAANVFRGAFGDILRRTPDNAAGMRIFAPRGEGGPSGFADAPRPFVLRAAALDGKRFGAGERFAVDINLLDPDLPGLDCFRQAFGQLEQEGLGPGRPRVRLTEAMALPEVGIDLTRQPAPASRIRVEFLTPTELKIGGETLREPRFDALFRRARDRVLQFEKTNPIFDLRGLGERAGAIRMTGSAIGEIGGERRSARTGQRHSLGGFAGEAFYEGELTEFLPWLHAAWWTGVGRLTVWGNGWIRVTTETE